MAGYVEAAGAQLERDLAAERAGAVPLGNRVSSYASRRQRLKRAAIELLQSMEGEPLDDVLATLYLAGEMAGATAQLSRIRTKQDAE